MCWTTLCRSFLVTGIAHNVIPIAAFITVSPLSHRCLLEQVIQGAMESAERTHRIRLESCLLVEQTIDQPHTWKVR